MLVGTIQGFLFAGAVLFIKKYRCQSNYFLVGMIIAVSLNSLQYFLREVFQLSYFDLMNTYYLPYASLNYTFLYLYVVTLLQTERTLTLKDKLLFLPFIFFVLATTIYKVLLFISPSDVGIQQSYLHFANGHEFFVAIYSLVLWLLVFKLILDYNKDNEKYNLRIVNQQLTWLKTTLLLLLAVIIIYTTLMVSVVLNPGKHISFYWLWVLNSFVIYWLGHIGIYKYGIQKERQAIRNYSVEHRTDLIPDKKKNSTINALEQLVVEDKRFLDAQMSLETIASELDVSKSHLSRLINSELNTSFTDYINELRVNEAKKHLTNPEFSNYTLVAIGLESGFNSKTTFYGTFKKFTGKTPLQFKNELLN